MGKFNHKCIQCGKEYSNYKERSQFCSNECKKIYRNSITYNCDYCGKEFVLTQSKLNSLKTGEHKHLFCSRTCADNYQRNSVIKICERCGKEYTVCNSFKDIQRFCSKECYKLSRKENSVALNKICPVCGKSFSTYHKQQIYCSKECAGKSQQNRVECTCEYCGKSFERIKSEVDKNRHHYCSKECKILDNSWSHEDIEILKKYYRKIPTRDIQKKLSKKRSQKEMQRKATWLGLSKTRLWSDKEINILKNLYSKVPMNQVLNALPNRTFPSVLGMARRLNLLSYFFLTNTYSKEEDNFIKTNYLKMTDKEIAKQLHRTPNAISQRLFKLDLHRPLEKHNYKTLSNYMRAKLYIWKQQYRERCNYTCALSGERSNIIVHHIYGFNLLISETIDLLNFPVYEDLDLYSQEQLDLFVKTFLELQEYYGEYICITETIHKQFHSIYGCGDNTREQWDEFVDKYYSKKQKIS